MERLTEKIVCNLPDEVLEELGIADISKEDYEIKGTNGELCRETCEKYECDSCPIRKAIEKLADYEDAEEQGLLLRFPCKIGSTLYWPTSNRINKYKVIGLCFDITKNKWMYEVAYQIGLEWHKTTCDFDCINKKVFLTKEEAEQALKQMGE